MTDWVSPALFSGRLQPGETIVWLGKPNPWTAASQRILPLMLFTLWTGAFLYSVLHTYSFPKQHPNAGFETVFSLFMVLSGAVIWLITLKNFLDCWTTAYALTDRRLIIATGSKTRSFTADALAHIARTGNAERGSLVFGGLLDGLYGIADPIRVEDLIYENLMPKKKGEPG